MRAGPRAAASSWLLFLVPAVIWGTTWFAITFQLGPVAPEVSVVWRFGLASLVLFVWCGLRRIPLRCDARTHASLALLGLLQFGISYVAVYESERHLTSGLVAVIFVLLLAWNVAGARLFFGTRLPALVLLGAALGTIGVALVFWPELVRFRGLREQGTGVALAVGGTLCASGGNLWSQRLYGRGIAVVPSTAWAMGYASAAIALWCAVRGVPFAFDASLPYVASLAYLSLFGSVFAFVAYLTLLRRVGSGPAGYVAAVTPILAMATSTVFEGYRWTALALTGMTLVLAGNVMVLRGRR